jgi:hypothetical protein
VDHQLDLTDTGRQLQRVVGQPGIVVIADEDEGGQPGEDADAGDAQGVVVEPQGSRFLVVRVLVDGGIGSGGMKGEATGTVEAVVGELGLGRAVRGGLNLGTVQVSHGWNPTAVGAE